jgi:hypothetical protein
MARFASGGSSKIEYEISRPYGGGLGHGHRRGLLKVVKTGGVIRVFACCHTFLEPKTAWAPGERC